MIVVHALHLEKINALAIRRLDLDALAIQRGSKLFLEHAKPRRVAQVEYFVQIDACTHCLLLLVFPAVCQDDELPDYAWCKQKAPRESAEPSTK
jgi:hypothetical protein